MKTDLLLDFELHNQLKGELKGDFKIMTRRLIFIALLLLWGTRGFACTDFLISTARNSWINGRSLEFAAKLPTQVTLQPAGEQIQSIAPLNCPGLKWASRYAYLGVSCITKDNVIDGLNEMGLSVGALWLPTTVYQEIPLGCNSRALAIELVGKWILGNFSTVAEVREGLSQIYVWEGNPLPGVSTPPLHLSIHDACGESIVVEFIDGEQNIYDNKVRVLTNYPTFDWQMTNLENYIHLRALNSKPLSFNGQQINLKGQGSGMLGVPGDWTPASRFVRMFYFKYFAECPVTNLQGVNLAFHLLNTVDIPNGDVEERINSNQNTDFTQWVVVKDLTNQILYVRTYDNQNIYRISLKEAKSIQGPCGITISINRPLEYVDVSFSGN